ncbi:MAG: DUF4804 domain-containing protein [Planctomycetes bacterium]|nr:DUF4804 domain-containing protein [Planctomycetota bacterium]
MEYDELLERSRSLSYEMPTQANRLSEQSVRRDEVEQHAASVRPVLHGSVLSLIREFLALKRELGTRAEQAVYASLDEVGFVSRLLAKRPLAFLDSSDSYLLRDGTRSLGGFELVGGRHERHPLSLEDLLSYDEMAISALLGVSVPTHFINSGSRRNRAVPGEPGSFEPRGIYVGMVGARFEKPEQMEWRHVLVTRAQNTAEKGYGPDGDPAQVATRLCRAWASYYGRDYLPTFEEAAADASGRYVLAEGEALLDTEIYKRRIRASVEVFLREADHRASHADQRAYVHAVGLGLGVWRIHPRQLGLMLEVYADVLREVPLPRVADLDFSWFGGVNSCGGLRDGEVFQAGGSEITIHFSERDPAAPLQGPDQGKLLVAMYAWDSNAFPGNEYWMGSLSASGDPAAACCSNIPELQNPDLNPNVSGPSALVFGDAGAAVLVAT